MEVHHHPDLHHRPKPGKEYFLEFLMIFLAVAMGFLAESLREHISDRSKEREYVVSMLGNLARDTVDLNNVIAANLHKADGLDTLKGVLGEYLDSPYHYQVLDSVYQYCGLYIPYKYIFESHDGTLVQLRNSGGYRLIQKGEAADSIAAYDVMNGITMISNSIYLNLTTLLYDTWARCFNMENVTMRRKFYYVPPTIIITDLQQLRYFYNKIKQCADTIHSYVDEHLEKQLIEARRLIAYLKRLYKIR